MMPCPFCVQGKTIVIDSRWDDTYKTIRRRRHCLSCSYRWTTLEVDLDQITILLEDKTERNPSIDQPREKDPPIDPEDN